MTRTHHTLREVIEHHETHIHPRCCEQCGRRFRCTCCFPGRPAHYCAQCDGRTVIADDADA